MEMEAFPSNPMPLNTHSPKVAIAISPIYIYKYMVMYAMSYSTLKSE